MVHNTNTQVTAWDTKVGGVQMKELERERMITKLQEEVITYTHSMLVIGNHMLSNTFPYSVLQ